MLTIRLRNENEYELCVQIDPWANVYLLRPHEHIEFGIPERHSGAAVEIDDRGATRFVTLVDCDNYMIRHDGIWIDWREWK